MITYSTDNEEEGKKAVSHYKVLKRNKNYSLLEVNIETGRKNQIRVHMQDLGHSVVGDKNMVLQKILLKDWDYMLIQ